MPSDPPMPPASASEILLYQSEDGQARIQVRLENESVWLTQRGLAELFQKAVNTINEHIANVYEEGELAPEATIRKFRIVQTEGDRQVERLIDEAILPSSDFDKLVDESKRLQRNPPPYSRRRRKW